MILGDPPAPPIRTSKPASTPAPAPSSKCTRCGGEMREGFIPDETAQNREIARWVAGKPEFNWWGGLMIGAREQRQITAFRCQECGYLELYALGR